MALNDWDFTDYNPASQKPRCQNRHPDFGFQCELDADHYGSCKANPRDDEGGFGVLLWRGRNFQQAPQ